jgi:peptidoglycan-N-acetylglucosamine deacetylase
MIAGVGLAAAALGALGHFGPALAGVPGLLPRCSPALAGRGRPDHIALTFDDGPHPYGTPAILDVLAEHQVSATFFLIAEALERHPDLGRRIADDGHEIAVHGWNHRPLPAVSPWSTLAAIRRARDVIAEITCATPRWFRPPYGVATGVALAAAARCDLRPVWWTRWGRDWSAKATPQRVAVAVVGNAVLGNASAGGETVLLHDSDSYGTAGSWRVTAAALPLILARCAAHGWQVGPLAEHGIVAANAGARTAGAWHAGTEADRRGDRGADRRRLGL